MFSKANKNVAGVFAMSAGFFFLFMAFNTAQNLESTIVVDNQLVNASLASLYGVFTCTAIFAPRIVQLLGTRLSMFIGAIPYVFLVFANAVPTPTYELFIPAFVGVGAGAAILWTAQGITLSRYAVAEAAATKEPVDIVTSRFNGYFWTCFQFNGAVGLVIASSIFVSVTDLSSVLKYLFIGFGIVGAVGLTILFFAPAPPAAHELEEVKQALVEKDANNSDTEEQKGHGVKATSLVATLRLAYTSRSMQLLIPILFYTGASLGFFSSMFPLAYQDRPKDGVTRLLEPNIVGYVAATFFLTNSISSFVWGKVIPRTGRRALFFITLACESIFLAITYLFATDNTSLEHASVGAYVAVFATAIIFAIGDSVLESQVPAIIQSPSFFPDEKDRDAANSNVRLWQPLGFTFQFVLGIIAPGASNVWLQAVILMPLLVVSVAIVFILDRYVQPLEKSDKGYTAVADVDDHA